MLSKEQLHEQLMLQGTMNRVVNPDWINANYKWMRAVMVEGVEALDHLGWKWWKKPVPNMNQFHMELVDIWHFVLSQELVHAGGDPLEATMNIRAAWRHPRFEVELGGSPMRLDFMDAHDLLHVVIGCAAFGEFNHTAFHQLMLRTGYDWGDLHTTYVAKNVLNIFRQKHGYKDGTYIKDWGGREDNEVLTELVSLTGPGFTAQALTVALEAAYTKVKEGVLK